MKNIILAGLLAAAMGCEGMAPQDGQTYTPTGDNVPGSEPHVQAALSGDPIPGAQPCNAACPLPASANPTTPFVCYNGACIPPKGCSTNGQCSDNQACNGLEFCGANAICENGTPVNCGAGQICVQATGSCAACTPSCDGKSCGDNGCGGQCGTCQAGQSCSASGQCIGCVPSCTGKACGDNGCGGSCGSCGIGKTCSPIGQCVDSCTPSCTGKVCGDNGCGATCGTCANGETCTAGACVPGCTSSCEGKVCGSNGCGGSCGTCVANGTTCDLAGQCISAMPDENCQDGFDTDGDGFADEDDPVCLGKNVSTLGLGLPFGGKVWAVAANGATKSWDFGTTPYTLAVHLQGGDGDYVNVWVEASALSADAAWKFWVWEGAKAKAPPPNWPASADGVMTLSYGASWQSAAWGNLQILDKPPL